MAFENPISLDTIDAKAQLALDTANAAQSAANAAQTSADSAIADAANAQATADGKVTTFFQTTAPIAEGIGDLWADTDDGNKIYRWDGSVWVVAQDQGISSAISAANLAQATADGKIVTYYQAAPPTSHSLGDLWVETDNGNALYRWDNTTWVLIRDTTIATAQASANTAQTTANGKNKIIYSTSAASGTAYTAGDTWFQFSGGIVIGQWQFNGSTWVSQTIGNTLIANLDAGKITTGTLSGIDITGVNITGTTVIKSTGSIDLYDSLNNRTGQIVGSGNGMTIWTYNSSTGAFNNELQMDGNQTFISQKLVSPSGAQIGNNGSYKISAMTFGAGSVTTDASGAFTITHGLKNGAGANIQSVAIFVTSQTNSRLIYRVSAFTTTTTTLVAWNQGTNAAHASVTFSIEWLALA